MAKKRDKETLQSAQGQLLKMLRQARGLNQDEIGELLGKHKGSVSRIERGMLPLSAQDIRLLAGKFGIKADDFLEPSSAKLHALEVAADPRAGGYVPVLTAEDAVEWIRDQASVLVRPKSRSWLQCPEAHGRKAFALIHRGDSMVTPAYGPQFPDGTVVFFDPDLEPFHKAFVFAALPKGETVFRLLLEESARRRYLVALNPSISDRQLLMPADAQILAVAIGAYQTLIP